MDIKERNKFCGLLMFNTFSVPNKGPGSSNDFIMNNYDVNSFSDQPEPYYKSRNDPQETSIAAGAAAPGGEENGKLSGCQKVQTEKRPPRPPNAFILYRREKQPAILAANRHLTNAEISRHIADLWRSESNETRLKWERFADQTKLEHMKAYPNYVYRPNKNKGKRRQGRRQPAAASTDASVSPSFSSEHQTSPVMNQQEGSTAGPIRPSTRGQNRVNMVGRRLELENQTAKMNAAADFQSMIPAAALTPPLEPASANAVRFDPLNIDFANTNVSTEELQISTPITPVAAQQHLIEIESLGRWKVVPTQPETVDNRDNMLFPSSQIYSTFHEQTVDPSMLFFNNHNNHDTTPTLYDPSAYSQNSTNTSSLKATNNLSDSVTGAGFSEFRDNPAVHNPVIAEILAFGEYFGGSANHLY